MLKCATCPWFQRDGARKHGLCMYEPPVIQVVMPPANALTGKVAPAIQGLRPPTGENDRCSRHPEWRQAAVWVPAQAAQ